jgi:hypothetical protein
LLALGAAFVAGLVARFSEQPVSAGVDGDVVLGGMNTTQFQTTITSTGSATALSVSCTGAAPADGMAVYGESNLAGIWGSNLSADPGYGVVGRADEANQSAIWGFSSHGNGVKAQSSSSNGLLALSQSGVPILAQVQAGSTANTIAIYGINNSNYAGPGPGAGGFGVYGLSQKGHGLVGATSAAGGAAVVGATNGVAGAYAAAFYGSVVVSGAFSVVGGPKSAAVPHPDGSHRRMYCLESPESWFEDFGKGTLECGRAEIAIDPDFAALVNLDDYQVFLTEYDRRSDLYVTDRTPTSFHVEARDTDSHARFGWRIVAKRKDIVGRRLEPVAIPPEPTLPPVPAV